METSGCSNMGRCAAHKLQQGVLPTCHSRTLFTTTDVVMLMTRKSGSSMWQYVRIPKNGGQIQS